jgi:TetR/AcrR family transcriptional regulator, transcriptional repressor for nem operon
MTAGEQTRAQIVEIADDLFYRQGFDHTSFADIAGAVRISRGNFYYHFRTKDDILDAVIARRLGRTQAMLDQWRAEGATPQDRLKLFVRILIRNQPKIMQYGCPVGTLCGELAKLDHAALPASVQLFSLFRTWLTNQVAEIGCDHADAKAMHLLAMSQGVATLATAFRDEAYVADAVDDLCRWIDNLKKGYTCF